MTVVDPGSGAFLFCSVEESTHNRLRENDEQFTDLQLWLNSASDSKGLTEALLQNISIQEVCLLIHESFAQQSVEYILTLFQALGGLPRLQKLMFNTYRFPFVAALPVQAFANIFQGTQSLVEFKLWRCDLSLLEEDDGSGAPAAAFQRWARALSHNIVLKEFRMVKCRLLEETQQKCTLDPMLQALGFLPNLQAVEVSAAEVSALGKIDKKALWALFHSSSLVELGLRNFDLSEQDIFLIAHSLLQHSSLDKDFRDDKVPNHMPSSSTSKLKHVRLSGVAGTASVLTKPLRDAFQEVLQSNFTLETLFLFDERNLQAEIQFYTKLNKLGRYRLLRQYHVTWKEWIDILVQVKDDLSSLFYFLLSCAPLWLQ